MKSGIYFLLKGREIVYVGQTKRFPLRFNSNNYSFDFNRIRFITCDSNDLIKYEMRWIKKFNPRYNQKEKTEWVHPLLGKTNPNAGNKRGNSKFNDMKVG